MGISLAKFGDSLNKYDSSLFINIDLNQVSVSENSKEG